MSTSKTVSSGSSSTDLFVEQARDVANMRSSLLSFDKTDPSAARKAIQNVTILRVYHQLERIVRFTEMMDKIEDRIYQSIDAKLVNADPDDESLWLTLIPIQERLQKTMVESHKLLEPYLSMEQLSALDIPQEIDPASSFTSMILEQESRERVRTGVQQIMGIIDSISASEQSVDQTEEVKAKAQEALAKISDKSSSNEPSEGEQDA